MLSNTYHADPSLAPVIALVRAGKPHLLNTITLRKLLPYCRGYLLYKSRFVVMPSTRYMLLKTVLAAVEAIPPVRDFANSWAINRVVKRARSRPHPLSTLHDYTSWDGLTDKRWSGRPLPFTLRADPSVAWDAPWNKPNWITTEFSLLYRWHALIPDQITWNETAIPVGKTFMDNKLLTNQGLLASFTQMSTQQAAELGPRNTASPLLQIEIDSPKQGRLCTLASYSDYCDYLGINRPYSMDAISSDPEVAALLRGFLPPRDVDFHMGPFCENRVPNSPLPGLILSFVALDAFSQALTNPLLSREVFKPTTFSDVGWDVIGSTNRLRDVVDRNVSGGAGETFISFTRANWHPE